MKIWGRANSNNVKKVLWCVEELKLPYERLEAGGVHGVVSSEEFGYMNPNRRVPVLDDNGLILWESNAIVRYLAATYGIGRLWSADPAARALADRWMDWSSNTFGPPFVTVFYNLMRLEADRRDHAAVKNAIDAASKILRVADAALASEPFLSGSQFAMGDIPLGCLIHAWFHLDIDQLDLSHVHAWYQRLLAMPAYRKVVALPLS